MKRKRKRKIIYIGDQVLTREERKNFSKDYPGERLCFRLRFPNFPIYFSIISTGCCIAMIAVKLLMQQ